MPCTRSPRKKKLGERHGQIVIVVVVVVVRGERPSAGGHLGGGSAAAVGVEHGGDDGAVDAVGWHDVVEVVQVVLQAVGALYGVTDLHLDTT